MEKIIVARRRINVAALRMRDARESDSRQFIAKPARVYEGDTLKIIYAYLPPMPALARALQDITYERSYRTGGLPTVSRIFGYNPRSTLRKDFCSTTGLAREFPRQHAAICAGAQAAEALYRRHSPDVYAAHHAVAAEKVRPEWRIGEVFTSGIANKDNQLRYHFDTGNFANVWSAMFVFKRKIAGGFLSVPEYDLCFQLRDHSVLLFDGQGLLHGVTPLKKLAPDAYRYSVVYYSLRQMWNCLAPTDELLRIRKLKTQRERKRGGL